MQVNNVIMGADQSLSVGPAGLSGSDASGLTFHLAHSHQVITLSRSPHRYALRRPIYLAATVLDAYCGLSPYSSLLPVRSITESKSEAIDYGAGPRASQRPK